jgi:hypothetical protein
MYVELKLGKTLTFRRMSAASIFRISCSPYIVLTSNAVKNLNVTRIHLTSRALRFNNSLLLLHEGTNILSYVVRLQVVN